MTTPRLVASGYLTRDDLVLRDDRVMRNVPGGGALFSAAGALPWVSPVGLHACTGADYPNMDLERIAATGIDLSSVTAGPAHGLHLWLLEEDETHKQQHPKLTSCDIRELDAHRPPLPADFAAVEAFHVATSLPETQRALAMEMRRIAPRALISLDIWTESFFDYSAYRDPVFFANVDCFLPSAKEIEDLWGPDDLPGVMRMLAAYGPMLVVVKRGEAGALLYDRERDTLWEIPALPVAVVDTVGAGDAFCGGFLAGLLLTGDSLEAAVRGTVSASLAIEQYGALRETPPDAATLAQRLRDARQMARQVGH
jgi:ribokinase